MAATSARPTAPRAGPSSAARCRSTRRSRPYTVHSSRQALVRHHGDAACPSPWDARRCGITLTGAVREPAKRGPKNRNKRWCARRGSGENARDVVYRDMEMAQGCGLSPALSSRCPLGAARLGRRVALSLAGAGRAPASLRPGLVGGPGTHRPAPRLSITTASCAYSRSGARSIVTTIYAVTVPRHAHAMSRVTPTWRWRSPPPVELAPVAALSRTGRRDA